MRGTVGFLSGLLFSMGLVLSGMTDANKVVGFLDVFGKWDPSLAFVMVGAIGTFSILKYFWNKKIGRPVFADHYRLPTHKNVGLKLIFGSMLFGIGWGLIGFCPGPAIVSLVTINSKTIVFGVSMLSGMLFYVLWDHLKTSKVSA